MVSLFYEDTEILDLNPEFFVSWLRRVCESEGSTLGELSIVFCSDDYLLGINREHLKHDYYTDIITFDYSEDNVSGDLFISIDRVRDNAAVYSVEVNTEINRVVVHGVLHLLGYLDKEKADKKRMRELENKYLGIIVSRET